MSKDKAILVTGATGLVGSYIVRQLLASGYHRIMATKRSTSDISYVLDFSKEVQWLDLELNDVPAIYHAVEKADIIIHAAAYVSLASHQKNKLYEINVTATSHLVNAALATEVEQFVYISSIAALSRGALHNYVDEKTDWTDSPYNTYYAKTKYKGELEVWRGMAEGLDVTVLNPGLILGSGNWESTSLSIFSKVAKGTRFYPSGVNGLVDVRDVGQAVLKCVDHKIVGERFVIVGENWKYRKLLSRIAHHLKVAKPNRPIPSVLAQLFAYVEKCKSWIFGADPLVTKETLLALQTENYYDNAKSINVLSMQYHPIEQTIAEASAIYLSGKKQPLSIDTKNS